ncbi:MAG: alpha/beta hydrolase [Pseudomonadota bacterium]
MSDRKMTLEDIDPELRDAFAKMPNLRLDRLWVRWLVRRLSRLQYRTQSDPGVQTSKQKLTHADVRIYHPKTNGNRAGLFWIHGGGMIMGDAAMNDPQCNRYARELGLTVVSANYRLAPEHPYPAAIDDCYEAWRWFLQHAEQLGVDPERIAIAGQSAGGGLAAALCQRTRDSGVQAPAAQLLIYPMLDDRTALRDDLTEIEHILWNNRNNRFGWSAYLGSDVEAIESTPDWAVPGRCNDLSNLPPTWIGVGDKDLFLEEDEAYAIALQAADVECTFVKAPSAPHAFDALVTGAMVSRNFLESADDFLKRHLTADPKL